MYIFEESIWREIKIKLIYKNIYEQFKRGNSISVVIPVSFLQ